MTYIELRCSYCAKIFKRQLRDVNHNKKRGAKNYCSTRCNTLAHKLSTKPCKYCTKIFSPSTQTQIFCSHSCAAKYNNGHKSFGTRVSKLEKYLQQELLKLYSFDIKFNSKEEINSELDIYIPHMKLAFELNGIFHYEPIYGPEKLKQIQNNDGRKFQACLNANIELCIIDTSAQTYFKEKTALKYLNIIVSIINEKI